MNDDETKACEIIRALCNKGLQSQGSALYAGISGSELSTRIYGVLTKTKKRQVLRKAQILITETNKLFGKLDNKLAKELVEIHLTDLRQRMKQLLGISRKRLKRENMDEIFETTYYMETVTIGC